MYGTLQNVIDLPQKVPVQQKKDGKNNTVQYFEVDLSCDVTQRYTVPIQKRNRSTTKGTGSVMKEKILRQQKKGEKKRYSTVF